MENKELAILEEKIDRLLKYLSELENERSMLRERLETQDRRIEELEQSLNEINRSREEARSRVAALISKIEDFGKSGDEQNNLRQIDLRKRRGTGQVGIRKNQIRFFRPHLLSKGR